MATEDTLIDIEAATAEIMTGMLGDEYSKAPDEVVAAGRRTIRRQLAEYNKTYNDLSRLYKRSKDDYAAMKASLDAQIAAYKKQVDDDRKLKEEEIKTAVSLTKKRLDEVSSEADLERGRIEKQRKELETKKREYRAEVDLHKKEAREAQEIQAQAEEALIEEKETTQGLRSVISSLERTIVELRAESQNWETEAYNTATLRENAVSALDTYREEIAPIRQRNQELQREVEKLKPALKRAQQMIMDSEKRYKDCEQQLKDTREQVLRQPDTPTRTLSIGSGKKSLLSDLRHQVSPSGSIRDSDVESLKSRNSASPVQTPSPQPGQDELAQEKERYQKLEAAIDSDYVPLETYERAVTDRSKELEDIKAERDSVRQANANCQAALKRLQADLAKKEEENKLAKKEAAQVGELRAKIKELEKRARTLEREVKTHKDRAQDQEKKLKQASERIAKLEKRELQQQTTITALQKNAAARGAAGSDKDGEIKRLSDAVVAARKEADDADTALQKEKEKVRQADRRYIAQQRLLDAAEADLVEAELKRDGFRRAAEQYQEVEDMLLKELHDGEEIRANLLQAIQSMLQPNIETDSIQQSLSNEVLDLIELRRDAFRFQEQLIPMAQAAAQDYGAITGEGFVVEGHGRDNGRPYISDPKYFGRSIRALYERFANSLRRSQEEIQKLKKNAATAPDDARAQEAVKSMQQKIDLLESKNKDLKQLLKVSEENEAKINNPAAGQDGYINAFRDQLKAFLALASPSIGAVDRLLLDLINTQKKIPGGAPFGPLGADMVRELAETKAALEQYEQAAGDSNEQQAFRIVEAERERKRLGERNRVLEKENRDKSVTNQRLIEENRAMINEVGKLKDRFMESEAAKEAQEYREKFEQQRHELRVAQRRVLTLENENEQLKGKGEGSKPKGDGGDQVEEDAKYAQVQEENERLRKENKRLQDENKEQQEAIGFLTDNLWNNGSGDDQSGPLKACERERERLREENERLKDDNKRLRDQIGAAGGRRDPDNDPDDPDDDGDGNGNGDDNNDPGARNLRLGEENERLKGVVRRLNDRIMVMLAEQQALRDELRDQANVIGNNGEQADRTRAALNEQISIFEEAQRQLMRDIEALNLGNVHQGRVAAESSRNLRFAREEVDRYKNLVTTLTIERDLLQDEVRLCVEAQQRARRRARENAAAGGGPVPGDNTGAGAEVVPVLRPGFFARVYAYLFRAVPYTMIWTAQLTVFVMMVAVIIAEGGRYAEWRAANQHTRALYMSLQNRPVLCLTQPTMDYFWQAFAVLLTGRWKIRWS